MQTLVSQTLVYTNNCDDLRIGWGVDTAGVVGGDVGLTFAVMGRIEQAWSTISMSSKAMSPV
jgi:hypothetical protein